MSGMRPDLEYFFSSLRVKEIKIPEIESGLDYEIEISGSDCEMEASPLSVGNRFNVFEQDDSENSKEVSGYLDPSPSNSREESQNRQSNFNTFFNQDKETQDHQTNPNSNSVSYRESEEFQEKKTDIYRLHSFGKKTFNITSNTFSDVDLSKSGGFASPLDSAYRLFDPQTNNTDENSLQEVESRGNRGSLDLGGSQRSPSKVLLPRESLKDSEERLNQLQIKVLDCFEQISEKDSLHERRDSLDTDQQVKVGETLRKSSELVTEKDDYLDIFMKKQSIFTYGRNNMKTEEYGSIRVNTTEVIHEAPLSEKQRLSDQLGSPLTSPELTKSPKKFISFCKIMENNKLMKSQKEVQESVQTPKPVNSNDVALKELVSTVKKGKQSTSRVKNFVKNMEKSKSKKYLKIVNESFDEPEKFFKNQKVNVNNLILSPMAMVPIKKTEPEQDSLKEQHKNPPVEEPPIQDIIEQKFTRNLQKVNSHLIKYIQQTSAQHLDPGKKPIFKSKKEFFRSLLQMLSLLKSYLETLKKQNLCSEKVSKFQKSVDGLHMSLTPVVSGGKQSSPRKLEKINLQIILKILKFLANLLSGGSQKNRQMPSLRNLLSRTSNQPPSTHVSSSLRSMHFSAKETENKNSEFIVKNPFTAYAKSQKQITRTDRINKPKNVKVNRSNLSSIEKNKMKSFNKKICLFKGLRNDPKDQIKFNNFAIFLNVKLKLKLKKIYEKIFKNFKKNYKSAISRNKRNLTEESLTSISLNNKNTKHRFFRIISKTYSFKKNLAFQVLKSIRLLNNRQFIRRTPPGKVPIPNSSWSRVK
jgi:hypothetical protein